MQFKSQAICPFIGAKNFQESRNFYSCLGFKESIIAPNLSFFKTDGVGFYLQDAYVKDWIDNSMIFLEVDDVKEFWDKLLPLNLTDQFPNVRLVPIKTYDWGKECFIHDPSGILWHVGTFIK